MYRDVQYCMTLTKIETIQISINKECLIVVQNAMYML